MDDYETLNRIGDGTFGTVYRCRKRKIRQDGESKMDAQSLTGEYYAIKKMKRKYYNWDDCINSREIKVLKKLNHQNIVQLKEVIRTDNTLYLVFEHMEENLHQLIHNRSIPFPDATIRSIVLQIANGLAYIHKHGFFHRDIKPENILCRGGLSICVKIADFGLTRDIDSKPPYTEYVSTRWYRAPELLLHSNNYGPPVDLWALGCVIGELYVLGPVFPGRSEIDQIFKICQTLGPPDDSWLDGHRLASMIRFKFPSMIHLDLNSLIPNCPGEGLALISQLLRWNPEERPTSRVALASKFFKDVNG